MQNGSIIVIYILLINLICIMIVINFLLISEELKYYIQLFGLLFTK